MSIDASASTKWEGAASLLGAAFIIGTFGLWVRVISPMFGNAGQTTLRFLIAAFVMAGILVIRRKFAWLGKRQSFYAACIGVASFGTGFLFTVAANGTKITNALSLMYAGGIVSAMLLGSLLLREKVALNKVLALIVAIGGLTMYAHEFSSLNIGVFAAIGAGVCDSIAHVFRKQLRGVERGIVIVYQYTIGAVVALLYILISGEHVLKSMHGAWPIVGLVAYGIASIGLGSLLLFGFSHFDVNAGAVILATQLVFAAILGIIFLHEVPALNEALGAGLVFVAASLTVVDVLKIWRKFTVNASLTTDRLNE